MSLLLQKEMNFRPILMAKATRLVPLVQILSFFADVSSIFARNFNMTTRDDRRTERQTDKRTNGQTIWRVEL